MRFLCVNAYVVPSYNSLTLAVTVRACVPLPPLSHLRRWG
jgi:hypothetical protein